MNDLKKVQNEPGVCLSWETKKQECTPIHGDEAQLKKTWEDIDSLAYTYIWQILLSF